MKKARRSASMSMILTTVVATALWQLAFAIPVHAQTVGNNAVYDSSGHCSPCAGSPAIIDLSVLPGNDICDTLYGLFTARSGFPPYPSVGAVIDARGVNGGALTCTMGTPWNEGGNSVNKPSTILLPPGIIVIPATWVLPGSTKLIGEGDNILSGTIIQACFAANCFTGGAVMQFCSSTCSGVSVENVMLNGNGRAIHGIVNANAGELSYVNHVSLYQILKTGLNISAQDSGPYSNINFNTGTASAGQTTVCAQISGVQTQGIHGLTCVSNGSPSAAVLLDASNNSIEDVSIDGFIDGIVVGENANAQSNVLFNIQYPGAVGLLNLIHICGNNNTYDTCPTIHTVTDLAIMGATVPPYNCQPGQQCLAPDATMTLYYRNG
jgi:hypothetical protein